MFKTAKCRICNTHTQQPKSNIQTKQLPKQKCQIANVEETFLTGKYIATYFQIWVYLQIRSNMFASQKWSLCIGGPKRPYKTTKRFKCNILDKKKS